MQNYEVQNGHQILLAGSLYRPGDVLPGWAADRDGGLAGRVEAGGLAPTAKPVNVAVAPPEVKAADDPTPEILHECERLRRENAAFATSNRELAGVNEGQAAEVKRLVAALGKASATIAHLTEACDNHQAEIERLTAELDAATAPAVPVPTAAK